MAGELKILTEALKALGSINYDDVVNHPKFAEFVWDEIDHWREEFDDWLDQKGIDFPENEKLEKKLAVQAFKEFNKGWIERTIEQVKEEVKDATKGGKLHIERVMAVDSNWISNLKPGQSLGIYWS